MITKKNFQVPMADMSEKALYFSMQCCTAKEPLRMVPGNLHTSSHTVVMKKGNFVIVLSYILYISSFTTKILYVSFRFYLINIFRCKIHKNIYSQGDYMDSSCRCVVQKRTGHLEDLRNYFGTKSQTSRLRGVCSNIIFKCVSRNSKQHKPVGLSQT